MYVLHVPFETKMFADPYYPPSGEIGGAFSLEVLLIRSFECRELDPKPPKLRSCLSSLADVPLRFTLVKWRPSVALAKVLAMPLPPFLAIRRCCIRTTRNGCTCHLQCPRARCRIRSSISLLRNSTDPLFIPPSFSPAGRNDSSRADSVEFLSYQNRFPSEPSVLHRKNEPSYRLPDYSSLYSSVGGGGLDPISYPDYYDSFVPGAPSMAPSRQGRSVDYRRNSLESGPSFLHYSANARFSASLFDDPLFPSAPRDPDVVPTDNFLFESPGLAPAPDVSALPSSKRTPPPLPPRSYLDADGRDAYSLVLPSTHSASASLLGAASKPVSGYWSRTLTPFPEPAEPAAAAPSGSQLTASAVPFVGSQGRAAESAAESAAETEPTRPAEERKKGDGEDVDLAKLYSGEETRSAVMIRNIPNRFNKEDLCEILNEFVEGKFSIMNMPLDSKTHRNLGYCFIQFNSIPDLIEAYKNVGLSRGDEL